MRNYRERISQEQREDIPDRKCQNRHEETEPMSVRDTKIIYKMNEIDFKAGFKA